MFHLPDMEKTETWRMVEDTGPKRRLRKTAQKMENEDAGRGEHLNEEKK